MDVGEKKESNMSEWPKDWPEKCPPEDAREASGTFYRNTTTNPPCDWDLFSHKERKKCGVPVAGKVRPCACNQCSLSVFDSLDGARHNREKYRSLGDFVAEATLAPEHGKVKLTKDNGHHEWWPNPQTNRRALFKKTHPWQP